MRGDDYETRAGDVKEMERVQGRNGQRTDMGCARNVEGMIGDRIEEEWRARGGGGDGEGVRQVRVGRRGDGRGEKEEGMGGMKEAVSEGEG